MYKNVRHQHNRFSFRLSVLGKYVDAGESYENEEDAGCAADLAKFYLRNTFKFHLEDSLGGDGEEFSRLSYRRGVVLSDSSSVEKALSPGVKTFVEANRAALSAHRDNQPPEPDYAKWGRHAPSMKDPAMREWVSACERAEADERAFKAIDHDSFFLRLRVVQKSFETALKSLGLASRMHEGVINDKLVARRADIDSLIVHLETTRAYLEDFSARLQQQEIDVASALSKLERPTLT